MLERGSGDRSINDIALPPITKKGIDVSYTVGRAQGRPRWWCNSSFGTSLNSRWMCERVYDVNQKKEKPSRLKHLALLHRGQDPTEMEQTYGRR